MQRLIERAREGFQAPADIPVWWETLAIVGFFFVVPFLGAVL